MLGFRFNNVGKRGPWWVVVIYNSPNYKCPSQEMWSIPGITHMTALLTPSTAKPLASVWIIYLNRAISLEPIERLSFSPLGHTAVGANILACVLLMTSSNGNIPALLVRCERNPPVTGGFPSQGQVRRSFDVFFDLQLNKRLGKHSRRRWSMTPSRSLLRHFNGLTGPIAIPVWSWKCNAIFPVVIGRMNQIEMLLCDYSNERTQKTDHIYHEKYRAFRLDFSQHQIKRSGRAYSMWHNGPVCVPILIVWTTFSSINMEIFNF